MAHHESAKKQMRQGVKRRARNRMNVSAVKTEIKKLREAIEKGDAATAKKLLSEATSAIDKAVKKGVLHDNAGSRHKSRLSSKVNALSSARS